MKLISDIKYLESDTFNIIIGEQTHEVEFKLGELPNDLKMLAFLAGELTNAAHYFVTFANVNKSEKKHFWKTFDDRCGTC